MRTVIPLPAIVLFLASLAAGCGLFGPGASVDSVTIVSDLDTIATDVTVQLTAQVWRDDGTEDTTASLEWGFPLGSVRFDSVGSRTAFLTALRPGQASVEAYIVAPNGERIGADVRFTVVVTFVDVKVGGIHACGLTQQGSVFCWGHNRWGTLGDGLDITRTTPVRVRGDHAFQSLYAGVYFTCGLSTDAVAYCWGNNTQGQLGDGTMTARPFPVAVGGGHRFTALPEDGGGGDHVCGMTFGADAYCWGRGGSALGYPTSAEANPTPELVLGGHSWQELALAGGLSCGIAGGGVGYCWGEGSWGRLGCGTQFCGGFEPVLISGGLTFQDLGLGKDHGCGITTDNAAYCWGRNDVGQLGDGTLVDRPVPTPVAGGRAWSEIAGGFVWGPTTHGHTCAVTTVGEGYCWGANESGQLGNGSTTSSTLPVPVSGGLSFRTIQAGGQSSCGITFDDIVYCWGFNDYGELGDGTLVSSPTPVRVSGQR